jgi:hypothetical protein
MQIFRDEWNLQETKKRKFFQQKPIGKEEEKRLLAQRQKEEGTLGGVR